MRNRSLTTGYRLLATCHNGFSLIEVMLALGVIAIGMIAIVGMIPQGIQASRDATDNTLSATIVQDTFNFLRTNSFNNAVVCDSCGLLGAPLTRNLATYDTTLLGVGPVSNAYDQAGFSTNVWAGAYYKVVLNYQPQPPPPPFTTPVLTRVTAVVVWPAQSKAPLNTNVFVTKITQYGL